MNEKRKILQLLRDGKISVEKAESLLSQLVKEKEKQLQVVIIGSDGERAHFNIPISIVSLLKGNIISITTFKTINDVLKEVNWEKLFLEISRKVEGEIANIKTPRGDQVIVNLK